MPRRSYKYFLLAVFFALPLWPQVNVGRISGTVTDSSGGAMPGVAVVATDSRTGAKEQTTTLGNGNYVFASLPPSTYVISAEKQGFTTKREEGIVLDAAAVRTVNFALSPGAVTETVSVTANAEQVETTQGDVSHLIDNRQIENIAMNGRNYINLINYLPGTVVTTLDPVSVQNNTTGQVINGSRTPSTGFYVDGVNNLDSASNYNARVTPNPDTIAEVRVLTSAYSAEYGGNAGAMVTVITKSGTRDFHGSVFEYLRNDVFDARGFFAVTKEPLHLNDFGLTFGGPFFIPRKFNVNRSKFFYYGAAEWRYYNADTSYVSTVPTAAERSGNFAGSGLTAPIDPLSGTPFPNEVIPANRWSYNGSKLLDVYPLPNCTSTAGNFCRNGLAETDPLQYQIKIDYIQSDATRYTANYNNDNWWTWNNGGALGINPSTIGGGRPGFLTSLNMTHSFSPSLVNYISFGVSQGDLKFVPVSSNISRTNTGVDFPPLSPINTSNTIPSVSITGFTGISAAVPGSGKGVIDFDMHDDITKVAGAHTLKFGAKFQRSRDEENSYGPPANENGTVTFNTSAAATSKNALADALLGNFYEFTGDLYGGFEWSRYSEFEAYAQDSWKVTSRLTLDYGLRWTVEQPPHSPVGNEALFLPSLYNPTQAVQISPKTGAIIPGAGNPYNGIALMGTGWSQYPYMNRIPSVVDTVIPGGSLNSPSVTSLFTGLPSGVESTSFTNVAPRFGFAYDPMGNGKLAVRGGFGEFYDRIGTDSYLLYMSRNPPFDETYQVYNGSIDNPAGSLSASYPSGLTTITPKFKLASMMTFNLNVQTQLPGKIIFEVGYVGTLGRHLLRSFDINQPQPGTLDLPQNKGVNVNSVRPYSGYTNIVMYDYGDTSNYNSMQTKASRRLNSGFTFGSSFTWSKALDYLAAQSGFSPSEVQNTYDARADYGPSTINRKFVFSLTIQYELPFAKHTTNSFEQYTVGGWVVASNFFAQSGAPNNITVASDVAGIGVASSRATVIPGDSITVPNPTPSEWFNTAAFLPVAQMPVGHFGTDGRNILTGPGYNELDLAIYKHFKIREKGDLEFRAESYNLPNHPSFTTLGTSVGTSTFGVVTAAGNPRIDQFGLKLHF